MVFFVLRINDRDRGNENEKLPIFNSTGKLSHEIVNSCFIPFIKLISMFLSIHFCCNTFLL